MTPTESILLAIISDLTCDRWADAAARIAHVSDPDVKAYLQEELLDEETGLPFPNGRP